MFAFRRPYPDELLACALSRGCRDFELSLGRMETKIWGGSPYCFHSLAQIETWSVLFNLAVTDLLWKHTQYPYYTAFRQPTTEPSSEAERQRQYRRLSIGRKHNGVLYRRYCPDCAELELRTLGESFWHRTHHLPCVLVCPEHSVPLRVSEIKTLGIYRDFSLPHEIRGSPKRLLLPASSLHIQRASVEVLNRGPDAKPEIRDESFYHDLAQSYGVIKPGKPISRLEFSKEFRQFYGDRLLRDSAEVTERPWPALMFSVGAEKATTVKHILMEQFLRNVDPSKCSSLNFRPVRRTGPNTPHRIVDRETATKVRVELDRLQKARQRITMTALLHRAGVHGVYTHRLTGQLPQVEKLVDQFLLSEFSRRPRIFFKAETLEPIGCQDPATAIHPLKRASDGISKVLCRADLIANGALLTAMQIAPLLGVLWPEVRSLVSSGRIVRVRYAGRNYFPAFWCDSTHDRSRLERLAKILQPLRGEVQYSFLIERCAGLGTTPLRALKRNVTKVLDAAKDFVESTLEQSGHSAAETPRSSKRPLFRRVRGLVRKGELVPTHEAARRMNLHWTQLLPLVEEKRTFCVGLSAQNFYPRFWVDGEVSADHVSDVLARMPRATGDEVYLFFVSRDAKLRASPLEAIKAGRIEEVLRRALVRAELR